MECVMYLRHMSITVLFLVYTIRFYSIPNHVPEHLSKVFTVYRTSSRLVVLNKMMWLAHESKNLLPHLFLLDPLLRKMKMKFSRIKLNPATLLAWIQMKSQEIISCIFSLLWYCDKFQKLSTTSDVINLSNMGKVLFYSEIDMMYQIWSIVLTWLNVDSLMKIVLIPTILINLIKKWPYFLFQEDKTSIPSNFASIITCLRQHFPQWYSWVIPVWIQLICGTCVWQHGVTQKIWS